MTRSSPVRWVMVMVVGGSLSKGLDVKLDRAADIEETAVGRYVVVQSGGHRFFSLITDVALDSTNPLVEKTPPDADDDFVREVMQAEFLQARAIDQGAVGVQAI